MAVDPCLLDSHPTAGTPGIELVPLQIAAFCLSNDRRIIGGATAAILIQPYQETAIRTPGIRLMAFDPRAFYPYPRARAPNGNKFCRRGGWRGWLGGFCIRRLRVLCWGNTCIRGWCLGGRRLLLGGFARLNHLEGDHGRVRLVSLRVISHNRDHRSTFHHGCP
jgi:hypothetical protein